MLWLTIRVKDLRALGIKVSVVSNADPRIRTTPSSPADCCPCEAGAKEEVVKTLESLSILPLLSHPPTLSWDVEVSKPSPGIFEEACQACDEQVGEGVIMVGDELKAYVPHLQSPAYVHPVTRESESADTNRDYRGARSAELEARLIRRTGEWSDGAARKADEDVEGVETVDSLTRIVEEVRRRNSPP